MLAPRDPLHYLKSLSSTTVPKRLLWLACSGISTKQEGVYIKRWQAGALGRTWYTSKRGDERTDTRGYTNPLALWSDADAFCRPNRRTVLWAWDLAEQMRLSAALLYLPQLGWHLDKIVLERTAAWALFRDHDRTLLMCDLKSWVTCDWGRIVSAQGQKTALSLDLPAGPDMHGNACAMRCHILANAVSQLLRWIDDETLGPFRPTGSGQSYAAYRRRFMAHSLLVHDDTARLHAERVAMWTGRCEAWQHGVLHQGPFTEYDMQQAYCRIAAECEIPIRAEGESRTRKIEPLIHLADTHAVLAHITVNTDVPVLPTKLGGRTAWPVGEFSTWVWDPELRLAADYCNSVTVHRAYRYQRGPALQRFARFVLDGMAQTDHPYGEVCQLVLKHWSRCLVGRLGLRYRSWMPFGTQPEQDLRLVTVIDCDERTSTDMLVAGNDRMVLSEMSEAPDSLPQIPSWVMSECRRRLWSAMMTVGLGHVVYIDTDSLVMRNSAPFNTIAELGHATGTAWTAKGRYECMTIHGPRNLVCQTERRVSGVPLTARQTAPLEFTGEVMRSIKESMRKGELDCIASIPRKFTMNTPDMRREHLPYNQTAPFRVQLPQQED